MALAAVECMDLTKRFYYYEHRTSSVREWFIRRVLRKPIVVRREEFSLRNVNLRVEHGEIVALVGTNGSGKSSMLRLIAGIYQPTVGTVVVNGRVAAIIELGAGFHPELTGAENVALYAAALGISRRELAARYDEIVEFSGVEGFLDVPIKYLSSGMEARLAFSVAVCVEPNVLLLDEVLGVGDEEFRQRCLDRLRTFHTKGGTIILVSHQLDQVRELCSRAIWLDQGSLRMDADVSTVLASYQAVVQGDTTSVENQSSSN